MSDLKVSLRIRANADGTREVLSGVNQQLTQIAGSSEAMGNQGAAATARLGSAQSQLLATQSRLIAAQTAQSEATARVAQAQALAATTASQLAAADSANIAAQTELTAVQTANATAAIRAATATTGVAEAQAILAATTARLTLVEANAAVASTRLATAQAENATANEALTLAENQATAATERLALAQSQAMAATARAAVVTQGANQSAVGAAVAATGAKIAFSGWGAAIAGFMGFALAKKILDINVEMESLRVRLVSVMKDADLAQATFDRLMTWDVKTPFGIQDLTAAFIKLKNFGMDPTDDVMNALTNTVAKLGGGADTLSGVTLALGQSWGKAKLQAQDTNQLIERGVPVYEALSNVTGKNSAALVKMMEAGELNRDVMAAMLLEFGKMADGSNARAMDTMAGKMSALGNSFTKFFDALLGKKAETAIKALSWGIDELTNKLGNATIQEQINNKVAKINIMQNEGMIGSLIDSLTLQNINQEKYELEILLKQKQALVGQAEAIKLKTQEQADFTKGNQGIIDKNSKIESDAEKLADFWKKYGTETQKVEIEIQSQRKVLGDLFDAEKEKVIRNTYAEKAAKDGAHSAQKSQLSEIESLQKAQADSAIKQIERVAQAQALQNAEFGKTLDFDYKQGNVGLETYLKEKERLIHESTQQQIAEIEKQKAVYQGLASNLDLIHAAIQKTESHGNISAVSTTQDGRHAIGSMQVLPSTLQKPGFGLQGVDMGGLNDYSSPTLLKAWAEKNASVIKQHGIDYLDAMLRRYGVDVSKTVAEIIDDAAFKKATAAYNAGAGNVDKAGGVPKIPETIDYVKKVQAAMLQLGTTNQTVAETSADVIKAQDEEAQRVANITALRAKESADIADLHRLRITESDADKSALAGLNIKYAELTGNTAQAYLQTEQLTQSTDGLYKKAVLLGNKDALAYFDAVQKIDPRLAPLLEQIRHYGLLEHEITLATAAEYELKRATATPADLSALDALIKRTNDFGLAQKEAYGQKVFDDITRQFDYGAREYADNVKKANEAFDYAQSNGFDTKYILQYQQKIKQEFDLASPAGQQTQAFFNTLKETSGQVFTALTTDSGNAVDAMLKSFEGFFDTVTASFWKLGQNSLFDWIQNGTMEDGGWLNVAVAGLSIGAKLLSNVLSAPAPVRTPSTAESYQSTETGAGAMAIVDSIARDSGFNFATKTAALFNQNLQTFSNTIQNNARFIFQGIGDLGDELINSQTFSWLGEAFGVISDGFNIVSGVATNAVNSVTNFLGITTAIDDATNAINSGVYLGATEDLATSALSKTLGNALAVVGAVYSIYSFITGIGDLIDNGTIGQIVGSVASLAGGLTLAWTAIFAPTGPIGWIVGGLLSVAGFLFGFFSKPHPPMLNFNADGANRQQFAGIQSSAFPESGGGIASASTDLGLIQFSSGYRGSMSEEAVKNSFAELLLTMQSVNHIIVDGYKKATDYTNASDKAIIDYVRNGLKLSLSQELKDANVSQLVEQYYGKGADLFGDTLTPTGIVFNKVYDILLDKFKATDDKTMAAMGIAAQVAGHLREFTDLAPLSFWDLLDKKIEGVGLNQTSEQVTSHLNASIIGFVALKNTLATIGTITDEAVVELLDMNGSIESVAANVSQFVIALKRANSAIDMPTALSQIDALKTKLATLSEKQAIAFSTTFGTMSSLLSETGLMPSQDMLFTTLSGFSDQLMTLADKSSEAANTAIDYAIAENHLQAASKDSAIQTLIRTKVIDEATATEADYQLAIQKVTKEQLDAMGFLQTFAIATGKTFLDLGFNAKTGSEAWFTAGKNVVAIFGDMKGAADFYTKLSGAFLTDDEQKINANRIAITKANSALASAKQAGLTSIMGLNDLTVTSVNDYINKLLKGGSNPATSQQIADWIDKTLLKGVGSATYDMSGLADLSKTLPDNPVLKTFIESLNDVGTGTAMVNLLNTFVDLKTTTDALTGSITNMQSAATDLKAYLDGLRFNKALGTLTPQEQFRAAQQDFKTTLASANAGNADAAAKVKDTLDQYLNAALAMYSHTKQYQAIYDAATSASYAYVDKTLPQDSATLTPKKAIKVDDSHRNGLDYVPFNNHIAQVYQGERIQTKEQAQQSRQGGNDAELIAQLKKQNETQEKQLKELTALVKMQQEAFSELIKSNESQADSLKEIKGSARRAELAK